MESNKAMIVISHSWEFVPKGSSHFYYHINSVKSSTSNFNNYKNTTTNDVLCVKNTNTIINNNKNFYSNNQNINKNRTTAATLLNLDENRSINESYNLLSKLALDNANLQDYPVR